MTDDGLLRMQNKIYLACFQFLGPVEVIHSF
jgi:hypothetical protein